MSLKSLYIVEDARGRVVKVYYLRKWTALQIQDEYGPEILTEELKNKIAANDQTTKYEVLWVLQRRAKVNPDSEGIDRLPIESIHILMKDKITLREHGYASMPVIVTRLWKNEGEEYGRGFGGNALPDVMELNALVEIVRTGRGTRGFAELVDA
jgi:hypothetical protein